MDRNLDGIYFRAKRDDKWCNACFSDLNEDEMRDVLKDRNNEWLASLCIQLGKRIKGIGDQLDLIIDGEDE